MQSLLNDGDAHHGGALHRPPLQPAQRQGLRGGATDITIISTIFRCDVIIYDIICIQVRGEAGTSTALTLDFDDASLAR